MRVELKDWQFNYGKPAAVENNIVSCVVPECSDDDSESINNSKSWTWKDWTDTHMFVGILYQDHLLWQHKVYMRLNKTQCPILFTALKRNEKIPDRYLLRHRASAEGGLISVVRYYFGSK